MTTYNEAVELAGRDSVVVSYAGGRARYVSFRVTQGGPYPTVVARFLGHDIAEFRPDDYTLTTAGHNTLSTVDALNYLDPNASYYNRAGVLYRQGEPFRDGSTFSYTSGMALEPGPELAPVRGVDAATRIEDAIDVFTYGRARAGVARSAAARLLKPGERLRGPREAGPGAYFFEVTR